MRNGRFVIAYLIHELGDYYCKELEVGAMQRAEEENIDLIFFPGKFIDRDLSGEIKYDYQYNTLYDLVIEDNVDAVIIAADCIGNYTTKDKIAAFIKKYSEIPCVLVASKEEGKSCICYDNFKGIEEGIDYLINEKGCRKFAMLGGPASNSDCCERKESLVGILEKRNIPFSDENYVEGHLSRQNTEQAGQLLDQNPDVEAIFCVNDECAVSMYQVMEERGLEPGEDIYILGYDNSRLAGQMRPTLSSIWADPMELSRQAFDMALNLIRGRKTPSRSLDTMLVKRDSFGHSTEKLDLTVWDTDHVKALYNKVFYRLQGARGVEYKAYQRVMRDCVALISADLYDPELHSNLKEHVREALDSGLVDYADMELLQELMDEIYEQISAGEERRKDRAEVRQGYSDIFRMLVAYQQENIRKVVDENDSLDYSLKMVAQDMMQFENGSDQNYSIPLKNLPYMGISNAYLYMLKEPIVHLDGEILDTPKELYLKAVLKDGEVMNITSTHQKISIYDLYCNSYIGDERYSCVMLPLYSTDELYGYVLCDLSKQVLENGEILVNQLSAAYRMLHVLGKAQKIMDQLEMSNEALKRNNIILDNLSKVDQMTGVFNRRGFYEAAEGLISDAESRDLCYMILYVDMDNLKIVNDRYGHDDGDFALKTISDILGQVTSKYNGVMGRMGGDEFACAILYDGDPSDVKDRIRNRFDEFNTSSDKPYNVYASAGVYKREKDIKRTLEEILAIADEDLYKEKQNRSKKTAKE
ncbi:MAG: GGDEF domain-containing protein [Lachnospiraceae bacterium]|nr:GGDEF domain-containing protein [Lachnospiraceae bacterium]